MTSARSTSVLISGASIAGPTLAYWLNRYGFATTIVERAPALREGGYAVDFRGDAHRTVLEAMGVLDEIKRQQTNAGATWYVNENGKKISALPEDLFAGDVEILRGDLARILYDRTKDRTEYIFDDSIVAMAEDADGVLVHFERGASRRYDIVVGADGLHSAVRSVAFGPEEKYVRELGLYCAIGTVPNHLGLEYEGRAFTSPGRMAAMYSARDNTEARAVFYFGGSNLTYDRRDVAAQRQILADAYVGMGWETPRLVDAMWRAPDFYFDSISQVHVDGWSRGRSVLLGDAAWCPSPLSGMGTGMAVVGAFVLAGELAAAGGDHARAFPAYEAAMAEYVRGCQKQGEGVAKWMVPQSKLLAAVLQRYYKVIPYLPGKKAMANSVRRTASNIALKSYGS